MTALLPFSIWVPIIDGDPEACAMYERHYSAVRSLSRRRERGTSLIVGPGSKLLLATPCRRGLFAWRRHISNAGQSGIECTIFRNEGAGLSSELISAADAIADQRWPGERHYTFVDPKAVRSANPGFCFLMAGYQRCGRTKSRGLLVLERLPSREILQVQVAANYRQRAA